MSWTKDKIILHLSHFLCFSPKSLSSHWLPPGSAPLNRWCPTTSSDRNQCLSLERSDELSGQTSKKKNKYWNTRKYIDSEVKMPVNHCTNCMWIQRKVTCPFRSAHALACLSAEGELGFGLVDVLISRALCW